MSLWAAPPKHADVKTRIQIVPGYSADYIGKVGDYEVIRLTERGWHEAEGQTLLVQLGRTDATVKMERLNDLNKWSASQTGEIPSQAPLLIKRVLKWTNVVAFLVKKHRLNQMLALAKKVSYDRPLIREGRTITIKLAP